MGHRGRIGYVWKDASRTYESVFKARSIPGKGKRMPKENKGDTVRLIVFGIVFELDNVNINVTKIGGRTTIHID